MLRTLDLFSCLGCHALGLHAAGLTTTRFIESNPWRREHLARRFPGIPIHDDVRTYVGKRGEADAVIGGPPCQRTSVAAAITGKRTGESLWPDMLRIGLDVEAEWLVVEQPPGNAAWETQVTGDLCRARYHSARVEFSACDCGAPYPRRRVFILASPDLSRLAIAWSAIASEIARAKRSADARGSWSADQLAALRVDALSAGEMDRSESVIRRQRIEALGDSNPPIMMEVIGRAILASQQREAA
jgi:DNA (cytosine-5)-methyltransferase 1